MDRHQWNARYSGDELVWSAEPNRFLAEEMAGLTPGRALDLGAGEGRNAVWLAERGWEVTAVDFADLGLDKGRRRAAARGVHVQWVQADLLDYVPPVGCFDLVAILYLHLPLPALLAVLNRARSALAETGVLLLIGHDRRNLVDGHGGPQDPAILYDADELLPALDGLAVERAERARRPVTTDQGVVHAVDTVIRARAPER